MGTSGPRAARAIEDDVSSASRDAERPAASAVVWALPATWRHLPLPRNTGGFHQAPAVSSCPTIAGRTPLHDCETLPFKVPCHRKLLSTLTRKDSRRQFAPLGHSPECVLKAVSVMTSFRRRLWALSDFLTPPTPSLDDSKSSRNVPQSRAIDIYQMTGETVREWSPINKTPINSSNLGQRHNAVGNFYTGEPRDRLMTATSMHSPTWHGSCSDFDDNSWRANP